VNSFLTLLATNVWLKLQDQFVQLELAKGKVLLRPISLNVLNGNQLVGGPEKQLQEVVAKMV